MLFSMLPVRKPCNSYFIICVFALLMNKVSLQDVNVAVSVTGGSAVLPCATSDIEHKLSDIIVFWRHNDSVAVYDIINGKFSLQDQDFTYTNRVETFPTEYEKGNFSLKLNNLTHTDGGNYQCFILHSSEEVITQLIIKESTVQTGEQPTEENGNQARETHLWMILTPALVVFMLCLILCITFIWKIRGKKTSRPEVPPPDGNLPCSDLCHHNTEIHGNGEESDKRISLLLSQELDDLSQDRCLFMLSSLAGRIIVTVYLLGCSKKT
ncbi:uncharacterized protein [Misgurnus anguillicaudatus]|uniref:uncharacterized protein isoform X2 n=1 Tax=Misgurnus anguillicaudatus TaxID=75329 RepID=UPI003CCFBEEC